MTIKPSPSNEMMKKERDDTINQVKQYANTEYHWCENKKSHHIVSYTLNLNI